jgi:uncharacterized protein
MNKQIWNNNENNKIEDKIFSPLYGVELLPGLFKDTFDYNRRYLKSLDMDAMLYWFRVRAGKDAPGMPYRGHFEDNIKGQTAGLYLMGAGHTLRWIEDDELKEKMNAIVDEIRDCSEEDGYLMAVPKTEFGTKEYPHYVRIWLTYGLTAAALAGNPDAFGMLRRWQDWFNQCDDLPIIRYLVLAFQGVVASTYLYNTPIGKKEDINTTIQYYEEDWRLAQFIHKEREAVHQRKQPGHEPHPHGTEIEAMEGYLDLYRATGKHYYLRAVENFYQLYQEDWQYPGSGIAMCETEISYPKCYWLSNKRHYNELCCTSFWLLLNQRFHRLRPDVESYVAEIEASIYNIGIANQNRDKNIFYFAHLDQEKINHKSLVHCCCGVGTKLFGALPEYIYSINENTLYIDLFAASQFTWDRPSGPVSVKMETDMPYGHDVTLSIDCSPQVFDLKVRVPRWVDGSLDVRVNGQVAASGDPGTYLTLNRTWETGDEVRFELPFAWKKTLYEGAEQVDGFERYAFETGPLLMAFRGPLDENRHVVLPFDPDEIVRRLMPTPKPLHYRLPGLKDLEIVPYFEIEPGMTFTCFPLFAKDETNHASKSEQ